MPNPWLSISTYDNEKIASNDRTILQPYINDCNKTAIHRCTLNLWPEPYMGNVEAPVYLLNGNPGYSNLDHLFTDDAEFVDLMQKNLQHSSLYPLNDFLYFNVIHTKGIVHGGSLWWKEKTKFIRQELCGNYPFVFEVEYSPYHSLSGAMPSQQVLQNTNAYKYTNELLLKAIESDKLFVIMRKQTEWINRLQAIASANNCTLNYNNILMLSSVSNVCISQNNVKYCPQANSNQAVSAWDKLINILKQKCRNSNRVCCCCCGTTMSSMPCRNCPKKHTP